MTTYTTDHKGRSVIEKDPNAVLDYSFDWTDWLDGVSDTISTATFTCTGATVVSTSVASGVATAWVSGGTVGDHIPLQCRIVTVGGRTEDRTVYLYIVEK